MENNTGNTLRIEVPVNDIREAAPLVIEIPNDAVIKLNGMPIRTELLAMMFTDQNPQRALCEQVKEMQEVIGFQDELIKKYSNRTADLETRLNEYETGMDAYEQERIRQREKEDAAFTRIINKSEEAARKQEEERHARRNTKND